MTFAAGDRVTVRGERWVVQEATEFADVTLLTLSSAGDRSVRRCRLLAPFDRPIAARRTPRLRSVSPRRWMHHLHAHAAGIYAFGQLRAPRRAAMDVLPFQLEPALALVRGHGSRFLLADEVGLGKTIQAGLMLAELRLRGWCDHALIVAPAGLRHQWAGELARRFDLRAAVIDGAVLAAMTEALPFDVNPWTVEPIAITSIDFLKQPEVLRAAGALVWDVLVVDEAHHATIASQRYDAVNTLAMRARHVMLLTATPHSGDDRDYRALCSIGAVANDEPILLFRRTREAAGLPRSRRAHLLPVKPTPDTVEMHRLLDAYVTRLWTIARESGQRDVQLVAMVLAKRAFSSARSLVLSLERRLAGLRGEIDAPAQTSLPFDVDDDLSDTAVLPAVPAFARGDEERAVVQHIIDIARSAQRNEPKVRALQRIVRRIREPLVIFTEYRDTLDAISAAVDGLRKVAMLHGGQTSHERRLSLDTFLTGAADVMLATDAGSEGLNLQGCSRVVVNLELPWSPIRLEQRIGRVDRIGQTRTVHAINLLAEGTAERTVLANLLRRIDRIRLSEIDIAASVISQSEPPPRSAPADTCARTIDLGVAARTESARIREARRAAEHSADRSEDVVPLVVHRSIEPSLVALYHIRLATGAGRLIEETMLPIRLPLRSPRGRLTPRDARAFAESLIDACGSELARHAREHAARRARAIELECAEAVERGMRRERAVIDHAAAHPVVLVQAGLFESRVLKEKWAADARGSGIRHASQTHAMLLEASSHVQLANEPELAMLLILCSQA